MKFLKSNSLQNVTALSIAALVLYIPANLYPFMTMQHVGMYQEATIYEGVQSLYKDQMWFTGTVVFVASVVIPFLKILGLLALAILCKYGSGGKWAIRLHSFVELTGKWSMLDVFLMAILVALIKFGTLATVTANVGSVAFTAVVVLTMLASTAFDDSLLEEKE